MPVGCEITTGRTRTCAGGIGGIKSVDVTEWENLDSVTIVNSAVTAMTLASGKQTFRKELPDETSNYKESYARNRQNGTKVCTQTLTIVYNDDTAETIEEIEEMMPNDIIVVVNYNDGTSKVAGLDNGMAIQTAEHDSGTAKEDRNGEIITLMSKQGTKAPVIPQNIVAALLIPAS